MGEVTSAEIELLQAWHKACAGDLVAQTKVVETFLPNIKATSKFYVGKLSWVTENDIEDLIQEGIICLLRLMQGNSFDSSKGMSLLAYVETCIRNEIKNSEPVNRGLTKEHRKHIKALYSVHEKLRKKLQRAPTPQEIAEEMKVDVDTVKPLLVQLSMLNAQEFEDGEYVDQAHEQSERIQAALAQLHKRDREVFIRHYWHEQTVAIIAEEMSLSASLVKKTLVEGRRKLRDLLDGEA